MLSFPSLPDTALDASSYTEETENTAASAEMEGGYTVTRRKFTRKPRKTITFTLRNMPDSDKATLSGFWESVDGGTDAFTFTSPSEQTNPTVYTVRFAPDMKLKFNFEGVGESFYNRWNLDVTLVEV